MKIDVPVAPGDRVAFRFNGIDYTTSVAHVFIGTGGGGNLYGIVNLETDSTYLKVKPGRIFCHEACKKGKICRHGDCETVVSRACMQLLPDDVFEDSPYWGVRKEDADIPFEYIGRGKPFRRCSKRSKK